MTAPVLGLADRERLRSAFQAAVRGILLVQPYDQFRWGPIVRQYEAHGASRATLYRWLDQVAKPGAVASPGASRAASVPPLTAANPASLPASPAASLPPPAPGGALVPFAFEGTPVRVIERDGEPWFVLADLCRVLDIANPRNVAARLDDDEKDVGTLDTPGGPQGLTITPESGMWAAVMTSRKAGARRFRRWVTAEVIPAIRKTGRYAAPGAAPLALDDPRVLRAALLDYAGRAISLEDQAGAEAGRADEANRRADAAETMAAAAWTAADVAGAEASVARADAAAAHARAAEAEGRAAELASRAAAAQRLADVGGSMCVTDAAKHLGIKPSELVALLLALSWAFRRHQGGPLVAHQDKIAAGLMEHIEGVTRFERPYKQAVVTAKGRVVLAQRLGATRQPGTERQAVLGLPPGSTVQ